MARVWIPSLMRDLTGGRDVIAVEGKTVGALIDALERRYPGVRSRLCREGKLDPGLSAHVDGRTARGLHEPVTEESEVQFLPAIAGG
ncbi:MAG: MoaD/ThiS family protein [Anaerolineae bacterium]|jgi:molybdopterin converting factor small subunit